MPEEAMQSAQPPLPPSKVTVEDVSHEVENIDISTAVSDAPKDDWHWDEKDLSTLVEAKLATMFDDQVAVEEKDVDSNNIMIKTTEAKQEGEAFLSRRRGKIFCTYNLKISVYWYGKILIGANEIGHGKGRIVLPEVSYDSADPKKWQIEAEFDRTGGFGACLNPTMKTRDLTEYEERLQSIAESKIAPEVRNKIKELVKCLNETRDKAEKGEKVLLEAEARKDKAESAGKQKQHKAKCDEYARELHMQMVGKKYFAFINGDNPTVAEVSLSCSSIDDEDLQPVLEVLKSERGQVITELDLSFNSFTDLGLQQLCAALGSGAAPNLKKLKLDQNMKLSDKVSKAMVMGLRLLRKGLEVVI